ncbi:hypothetical protein [Pseudomonas fluorescens]|nr:hypothetical protein [Pseudomonas fluorescens]
MDNIPTFGEWFARDHGGRSFEEHYRVEGSRLDAVFMWYMNEIAAYAQAMAQLTHDTMLKELEGRND